MVVGDRGGRRGQFRAAEFALVNDGKEAERSSIIKIQVQRQINHFCAFTF
jgi:hypothetical protein